MESVSNKPSDLEDRKESVAIIKEEDKTGFNTGPTMAEAEPATQNKVEKSNKWRVDINIFQDLEKEEAIVSELCNELDTIPIVNKKSNPGISHSDTTVSHKVPNKNTININKQLGKMNIPENIYKDLQKEKCIVSKLCNKINSSPTINNKSNPAIGPSDITVPNNTSNKNPINTSEQLRPKKPQKMNIPVNIFQVLEKQETIVSKLCNDINIIPTMNNNGHPDNRHNDHTVSNNVSNKIPNILRKQLRLKNSLKINISEKVFQDLDKEESVVSKLCNEININPIIYNNSNTGKDHSYNTISNKVSNSNHSPINNKPNRINVSKQLRDKNSRKMTIPENICKDLQKGKCIVSKLCNGINTLPIINTKSNPDICPSDITVPSNISNRNSININEQLRAKNSQKMNIPKNIFQVLEKQETIVSKLCNDRNIPTINNNSHPHNRHNDDIVTNNVSNKNSNIRKQLRAKNSEKINIPENIFQVLEKQKTIVSKLCNAKNINPTINNNSHPDNRHNDHTLSNNISNKIPNILRKQLIVKNSQKNNTPKNIFQGLEKQETIGAKLCNDRNIIPTINYHSLSNNKHNDLTISNNVSNKYPIIIIKNSQENNIQESVIYKLYNGINIIPIIPIINNNRNPDRDHSYNTISNKVSHANHNNRIQTQNPVNNKQNRINIRKQLGVKKSQTVNKPKNVFQVLGKQKTIVSKLCNGRNIIPTINNNSHQDQRHTNTSNQSNDNSINISEQSEGEKSKKWHIDVNILEDLEKEETIVSELCNEINTISKNGSNLNTKNIVSDLKRRDVQECYIDKTRQNQSEKPYTCNVCEKAFSQQFLLIRHHLSHTGEKPHICNICQKGFSLKFNLDKHIKFIHMPKSHIAENLYFCEWCSKGFKTKYHLQRHIYIHTGERPFNCNVCNKSFTRKSHLKRHIYMHSGKKPYACNVCKRSFSLKRYLERHSRVHTGQKPYSCDVCQMRFYDLYPLREHSRLHSGEQPYTCDICQRTFEQKTTLRYHIKAHLDTKLNKCKKCDKSFRRVSSYKAHIRKKHKNKCAKAYTCNICQNKYATLNSIKRHSITHTTEKLYTCDVCKKKFISKSSCRKHTKLHIKSFICDMCKRSFPKKCSLASHIRILHKPK